MRRRVPVYIAVPAIFVFLVVLRALGLPLWLHALAVAAGAAVYWRYLWITGGKESARAAIDRGIERRAKNDDEKDGG